MAKCVSCGRKLTSEKSIACGIGSECRNKARKAGTSSKRGNSWKHRVARTIGFAHGKFEIGNTKYCLFNSHGVWTDGTHVYSEPDLKNWLEKNKQIIISNEVPDKIYVLLTDGKSIEEIMKITLDNIEEV